MISFVERNEKGLHCKFCGHDDFFSVSLFETSPIKGIVCAICKEHLHSYMQEDNVIINRLKKINRYDYYGELDREGLNLYWEDLKEIIDEFEGKE